MSIFSGEGKIDFIIARRVLEEDVDSVTLHPVFLILGAPESTETNEIKTILEKSGDYEPSQWREYRIIPSGQWEAQENWSPEVGIIHNWVADLCEDEMLLSHVHEPAAHGTTYDELVSRFYDEKRITLRLPWTLHVALDRAAGDTTLNSYCIKILADAVNYTELEEFEAQRRKPGRPKKTQNAE